MKQGPYRQSRVHLARYRLVAPILVSLRNSMYSGVLVRAVLSRLKRPSSSSLCLSSIKTSLSNTTSDHISSQSARCYSTLLQTAVQRNRWQLWSFWLPQRTRNVRRCRTPTAIRPMSNLQRVHHPPARRNCAKAQRSRFWEHTSADRAAVHLQEVCPTSAS